MGAQRLKQVCAYGEHRIEGAAGILEDKANLTAADFSPLLLRQQRKVAALEQNAAGLYTPAALQQPQQG
jgi:hypothetical protein